MVQYTCEDCCKVFTQKSHYDSHKKRKTSCKNNISLITNLINQAIQEKIKISHTDPIHNSIGNSAINQVVNEVLDSILKQETEHTSNNQTPINSRLRQYYNNWEITNMDFNNKIILLEIDQLNHNKKSVIYDNQTKTSLEIIAKLQNRKRINVMVIAKTQSGKTGTMLSVIKQYLNQSTMHIPIENIYIITGLSDTEWTAQTRDRMPAKLQQRVYHRDNLTRNFIKDIKDKKNVLIIMDEIQIAAKDNQTINKIFETAGFYSIQELLKRDIKIIEFTATPDGTMYDMKKWGEYACKITMEPGIGYVGSSKLLESSRVKPYKDLCGYNKYTDSINPIVYENIKEIKEDIEKYTEPKYHIIRTPNGPKSDKTINNFYSVFSDSDIRHNIIKYDMESEIENINTILANVPDDHTFIFIKEKLRCAKTLHKTNLGVLYERYTKHPNDSVIIQGLLGRATGYDDTGDTIIYTHIPSIIKYQTLWENNFSNETNIKWISNTTKGKSGNMKSKGTFNSVRHMNDLSESSDENDTKYACYPPKDSDTIFTTKKDAIKEFKKNFPSKKRFTTGHYHQATKRGDYDDPNIHWVSSKINPWSINIESHFYNSVEQNTNTHFDGNNNALLFPLYEHEHSPPTSVKWVFKYIVD